MIKTFKEGDDINKMRIGKEDYYMGIAEAVSERSTCLRRHYGAVIVKNDEIIATGYNGAVRGEPNCCDTGICRRKGHEHNDGDYSDCPAVHAEQNALISASRKDTIGATLYLYGWDCKENKVISAEPCPICSRMLLNAGITRWNCSCECEENKRKEDGYND